MAARKQLFLSFGIAAIALLMVLVASQSANSNTVAKNSWRGITPLHSSSEDVAHAIGAELESPDSMLTGPYKVADGEVTFSYLTPSLAKIYHAPRTLVGKVFTIYFKPRDMMTKSDLTLGTGFKQCLEQNDRSVYYFVNDAGVAYRFLRNTDRVETVIYQPSKVEVRSLSVMAECVF